MGTIKSSESKAFAAYLRSQRSTTQAQVDRATSAQDVLDFSPAERLSSHMSHTSAAASAH